MGLAIIMFIKYLLPALVALLVVQSALALKVQRGE
jgi:hypothetical protein